MRAFYAIFLSWLTVELLPYAPDLGRMLILLAEYEDAGDRQPGVLARMDPDVSTWIRRIRKLPKQGTEKGSTKKRSKKAS